MLYLKQSTASQIRLIGPFLDATDGVTAETGLTIANTDIRLSKNGGNMASKNSDGGTHDEEGMYAITFDATDTNTVGALQLSVQDAAHLPVYHEYTVLEEAVYDDLYGASATGIADKVWDEDVVAAHGTADTAGLLLRVLGALISQRANNPTLNAVLGVPDNVGADVPSATTSDVWNRPTSSHTAGGSFGAEVQSHALSSEVATAQADLDILTGADGANLLSATQASIDAIEADTNELQTDDVPGLIAALNDLSAAEVNTEVDTAFTTQIADSVPADGTIPTREQSLLMITRFLWEKAVSGTTVTVTKEDGSTSNMTFTLDDGTNPTSITRAT